ncbi:hypothetical protein D9758_009462 [Tetrapyrgos nigripes]|uniref:Nephrocystin 3-like N-terminal domain-containing protein n=1 Tax=Tetrapyrgos nigripes TaxID=182062 RepID=A0A8H5LEK9_9AGAR|nr:hypothetical protein D9758_009462 [Tetrapyrgos nigripes]
MDVEPQRTQHSLGPFAQSHHNSFLNSHINVVGGNQTIHSNNINGRDTEDGLKLLYQTIAHVGAFHDSEARFPPPKCHPKTRTAVLGDISTWISGGYPYIGEADDDDRSINSDVITDHSIRTQGELSEDIDFYSWEKERRSEGSTRSTRKRHQQHTPAPDHSPESKTPIHWLYGPAGVGKSAIAQTLAERFVISGKSGHLVASFFFSRLDPARNNPKYLFTTIAYCLATYSRDAKLRAAIDDAVRLQPALLGASIDVQFRELILNPLHSLRMKKKDESREQWRKDLARRWENLPKLVIIDGLDECQGEDSQRRVLLTILNAVLDQPRPLRFLIASRPEPTIRDLFSRNCHYNVTTRTELSDNHETSKGIGVLLRDGFKKITMESHRDAMQNVTPPWPPDGVIDDLVQRASGQFIYASTVLKYIGDEYSHPVERLELVLGLPVGDPDAFSDIDILYRQILSSNRNKDRLMRVLGAFLVLQNPLISTTERLYRLPFGSISITLRGLHSVLRIGTDTVEFYHQSFQDFLQDLRRSGEYFIDTSLCHEHIAQCYIKLINDTDVSDFRSFGPYNFLYHVKHAQGNTQFIDALQNFISCDLVGCITKSELASSVKPSVNLNENIHFHLYDHISTIMDIFLCYFQAIAVYPIDFLTQSSHLDQGLYISGLSQEYLPLVSDLEVLFAYVLHWHKWKEFWSDASLRTSHREAGGFLFFQPHFQFLQLGSLMSKPDVCICLSPSTHARCQKKSKSNATSTQSSWQFIKFSKGYSSLFRSYLKYLRLDEPVRPSTSWYASEARWHSLLQKSSYEADLIDELRETIPHIHDASQLRQAILWFQQFPHDMRREQAELVISECTGRITVLQGNKGREDHEEESELQLEI